MNDLGLLYARLYCPFYDCKTLYLRLNAQKEQAFQTAVGTLEESEQEGIMQIITSWTEQGKTEGKTEEVQSLVPRPTSAKVIAQQMQKDLRTIVVFWFGRSHYHSFQLPVHSQKLQPKQPFSQRSVQD